DLWLTVLADREVPTVAATAPELIVGVAGTAPKVLVVDDTAYNRSLIIDMLEPLGFEMYEAENGAVGLRMVEAHGPDIVIADVRMPVMDGYELIRQLRSNPKYSDLKIIVHTASVGQDDRESSLRLGADLFLPKPLYPHSLLTALAGLLKISWIYAKPEVPTVPAAVQLVEYPEAETLDELLEFAEAGDVEEILARSKELMQNFPQFAGFIAELAYDMRLDDLMKGLEDLKRGR
ncbi:hypothetical protein TI04_10430, partial [Achromatium sp. WMS2]